MADNNDMVRLDILIPRKVEDKLNARAAREASNKSVVARRVLMEWTADEERKDADN